MEDKQYTRAELEEKLTGKENAFCHEYLMDWNAARSARDAGYSVKTAKETGYENLTKPHIKQYLNYLKNDLEGEAGLSKLMAVKELKKFAFNGFEKINNTWITRNEFESLPPEVKACISEIDTKVYKKDIGVLGTPDIVDVEHVKIKLMDRRGALQDLAKLLGWNAAIEQKVNVTATTPKVDRIVIEKGGE